MNKKGSIVVVVVLLLVALSVLAVVLFKFGYLDSAKQADNTTIPGKTVDVSDQETADIKKVEPGDDVSSIDKDLVNTNLNSLDQEVLGVKTEADSL